MSCYPYLDELDIFLLRLKSMEVPPLSPLPHDPSRRTRMVMLSSLVNSSAWSTSFSAASWGWSHQERHSTTTSWSVSTWLTLSVKRTGKQSLPCLMLLFLMSAAGVMPKSFRSRFRCTWTWPGRH